MEEPFDVAANQHTLVMKCAKILCSINNLANDISPNLSHIMKVIHAKVSAKWGSAQGKIAVTSFFFLRYVCPSLVSPSGIRM